MIEHHLNCAYHVPPWCKKVISLTETQTWNPVNVTHLNCKSGLLTIILSRHWKASVHLSTLVKLSTGTGVSLQCPLICVYHYSVARHGCIITVSADMCVSLQCCQVWVYHYSVARYGCIITVLPGMGVSLQCCQVWVYHYSVARYGCIIAVLPGMGVSL